MAVPKNTQTRFVGITSPTIHPYTHSPCDVLQHILRSLWSQYSEMLLVEGWHFLEQYFGAETLVEALPNNKAVLFLMRCHDANLAKCMEHRETIIHQIRKCAKEFCGTLEMREIIIFPPLVEKYPICFTPSTFLFDIEPLAFAIVNITSVEQPYASSLTGTNTMPICDLLKF